MTVQMIDYCIIGAGPAGLQMGYELKKAGLDTVILESNTAIAEHLDPAQTATFSWQKHLRVAGDHPQRKDRFSLLCDAPHLNLERYLKQYQAHTKAWVQYLRDFADYYQLPIQYDREVTAIATRDDRFLIRDRHHQVFLAKYVVIATTSIWRSGVFAASCEPDSSRRHHYPELTHEWESVNVPNLFFIANAAPAEHNAISAYRHSVRALARIFACKHHGRNWPGQGVNSDPSSLADIIAMRLNNSAALWQEASLLCDYVDLSQGGTYLEAVPCRRIHSSNLGKAEHYLTVHFEIGPGSNPFMGSPALVTTCHASGPQPVIRYWHNGRLLESQRLPLEAEALQNALCGFLQRHLRTLSSLAG